MKKESHDAAPNLECRVEVHQDHSKAGTKNHLSQVCVLSR